MSATATRPGPSDAERSVPLFWLWVFAALSIAVLLFAFQQVVHSAVQKAQSQRLAEYEQADSLWRCKYLPTRAERVACRAGSSDQPQPVRVAPANGGSALTTAAVLARP